MKDRLLERLRQAGLLQPAFVEQVEAEEAQAAAPDDRDADGDADAASAEALDDTRLPARVDPARNRPAPPHLVVLRLCDRGALEGGLSVALGVRPDELVGPLCVAIGGSARSLRVLDVRDRPVFELRIGYRDIDERWEVEDLYGLVHNLNDLFRGDAQARAVAVLGEWEDALQLWCVKKAALRTLLRQDFFAPRNRHDLEPLVGSSTR